MKKDSFYRNSILLTLSNLTTGVLGFIFSIMLSRELGAEGMGLYGLIMPVYNLFICLICGGIITAVSKIAAEYYAKVEYKNLRKSIRTTLSFNILWATLVVLFVFIFSNQISSFIIKDPRTLYALRLTCPAMVFIGLSNTLKGYFYGTSNVGVPAIIDIAEKSIRILVLFTITEAFSFNSVTSMVTAAYLALCIGEFVSLLLLYIYYKYDIKKYNYTKEKLEGRAQLIFNVLVISLPLCLNGFVSSILSTASTLIIPRRLISAGIEYKSALAMIGKFSSMSLNIVFFPMIVIGSISTVLIPDLSQSMSKKDFYAIEERIASVLRLSFLLGLSTLLICIVSGNNLGVMFYNRTDLGNYIRFAALSSPIYFTAVTTNGILNGLGKQNIILRNSLITSVLELVLLYIFTAIPTINIYGYGITMIITSSLLVIMNLSEIKKLLEIRVNKINTLLYILLSLLFFYIMKIMMSTLQNDMFILKNIIIIITGFLFTVISIVITKLYEKRG